MAKIKSDYESKQYGLPVGSDIPEGITQGGTPEAAWAKNTLKPIIRQYTGEIKDVAKQSKELTANTVTGMGSQGLYGGGGWQTGLKKVSDAVQTAQRNLEDWKATKTEDVGLASDYMTRTKNIHKLAQDYSNALNEADQASKDRSTSILGGYDSANSRMNAALDKARSIKKQLDSLSSTITQYIGNPYVGQSAQSLQSGINESTANFDKIVSEISGRKGFSLTDPGSLASIFSAFATGNPLALLGVASNWSQGKSMDLGSALGPILSAIPAVGGMLQGTQSAAPSNYGLGQVNLGNSATQTPLGMNAAQLGSVASASTDSNVLLNNPAVQGLMESLKGIDFSKLGSKIMQLQAKGLNPTQALTQVVTDEMQKTTQAQQISEATSKYGLPSKVTYNPQTGQFDYSFEPSKTMALPSIKLSDMNKYDIKTEPFEGGIQANIEGYGTRYVKPKTTEESKGLSVITVKDMADLNIYKDKDSAPADAIPVYLKGVGERFASPKKNKNLPDSILSNPPEGYEIGYDAAGNQTLKKSTKSEALSPIEKQNLGVIVDLKNTGSTLSDLMAELADSLTKGEINFTQYNRLAGITKNLYTGQVDPATQAIIDKLSGK